MTREKFGMGLIPVFALQASRSSIHISQRPPDVSRSWEDCKGRKLLQKSVRCLVHTSGVPGRMHSGPGQAQMLQKGVKNGISTFQNSPSSRQSSNVNHSLPKFYPLLSFIQVNIFPDIFSHLFHTMRDFTLRSDLCRQMFYPLVNKVYWLSNV